MLITPNNDHPYSASVEAQETRGAGLEIRLYEVDPDSAEATARERGDVLLTGPRQATRAQRGVSA